MFDKLDELVEKLEQIMKDLSDPDVVNDQARFRKLMKEQSDLTPIVEKYKEYKQAKQDEEDSLMILDEESDEEMKELAKEELSEAKKAIERCEQELKILLLPKDANDDKNVVVETEPVLVVMRQHSLRESFIVCISTMQRRRDGRQNLFL